MRSSPIVFVSVLVSLALGACNAAPEGGAIHLGPDAPLTTDTLVLVVDEEPVDPNGHAISRSITWMRNQLAVPELDGATEIAPELTAAGDVWEVTLVPTDEKGEAGPSLTASTTVRNAEPTATVSIAPVTPLTGEALVADASTEDVDDDTVTLSWKWLRDGTASGFTTPEVPAGETQRGETWTVQVTPNDGTTSGETVEDSVVIDNAPPVATSVSLAPSEARTDQDIVATVVGVDDDGDDLTWTFTWFLDGVVVPDVEGGTLAASLTGKGEQIRVEAFPHDGFEAGNTVTAGPVRVVNTPPSATSAAVAPGTLYTDSDASCAVVGWEDLDGDAEGYVYSWEVDGVAVGTEAVLPGAAFSRDARIRCIAIPDDGEDQGAPVTSDFVTVHNTPPVLASADLSPASPREGDTISVTLGAASDLDGDTVSYAYTWLVNGTALSVATSTLSSRDFDKDDTIEVQVTPTDGTDAGTPVSSASVTAANTPPVVTGVGLSPSSVYTMTAITAAPAGTDADGDTLAYTYAWFLQNEGSGSFTRLATTGSVLPASSFDKDDVVYVQVVALDGDDSSDPYDSGTVTVLNSAPASPASVALTPSSPTSSDALTCTVGAGSDVDGDALTYEYTWERNGSTYTTVRSSLLTQTLASSVTTPGDTWACHVRTYDGTAYSAVRSSATASVIGASDTWTFVDTTADDVTSTSLRTFFSGLGTVPTSSYIFFEIDTKGARSDDGAWCSARADWYVSQYLSVGTGSAAVSDGAWNKWSRGISGTWSSPTTTTYTNYYGAACDGDPYSWCSNWGLGGKYLGAMPNRTGGECYSRSFSTGAGSWEVTITVGATRMDACGF